MAQDIPDTLVGLLYDKSTRERVRSKDSEVLKLLNISQDVEIKVLTSSRNIIYVVMPARFNQSDVDQQLEIISAADKASTAGSVSSVGSLGSVGSICSTVSTAASAGTVGSAASAGSVEI